MADMSFKDYISSEDPAVWIGTITFFVILITEAILAGKGLLPSFTDRRMEEAKEKGNVVLAKRTKYHCSRRNSDGKGNNRMYSATYEYQLNGVTRKKHITSDHSLPTVITIYYKPGSRKVLSSYDTDKRDFLMDVLFVVLPFLGDLLVMKLLGYNG